MSESVAVVERYFSGSSGVPSSTSFSLRTCRFISSRSKTWKLISTRPKGTVQLLSDLYSPTPTCTRVFLGYNNRVLLLSLILDTETLVIVIVFTSRVYTALIVKTENVVPGVLLFNTHLYFPFVFAARCYASAAYVVMRCPSVCLSLCVSDTFVHSVKTNKHIFKLFSLPSSHAILVFSYQTA